MKLRFLNALLLTGLTVWTATEHHWSAIGFGALALSQFALAIFVPAVALARTKLHHVESARG